MFRAFKAVSLARACKGEAEANVLYCGLFWPLVRTKLTSPDCQIVREIPPFLRQPD